MDASKQQARELQEFVSHTLITEAVKLAVLRLSHFRVEVDVLGRETIEHTFDDAQVAFTMVEAYVRAGCTGFRFEWRRPTAKSVDRLLERAECVRCS